MGLLINPYALIYGRLRPFAMPCSLVLRVSAGRIYCPFISVFLSLGSKVCCYARLWLTSGVEIPYYFNRPSDSYNGKYCEKNTWPSLPHEKRLTIFSKIYFFEDFFLGQPSQKCFGKMFLVRVPLRIIFSEQTNNFITNSFFSK